MIGWLAACETPSAHPEGTADSTTTQTTARFEKLPREQSGVHFANRLPEDRYRNILLYQYYYNGGGVAAGDVDNDGDTDLFFTGNTVANKLYRNEGNLEFQDVSIAAGIVPVQGANWCTGVTMADVNADGWLDIYVSRSGNLQPENRENLLYINQQDGTFLEQAKVYGLNDPGYSVQAAFFDYDRDSDLDVFLINHGMEYYGQIPRQKSGGSDPFIGDRLYRNDAGKFTDVSQAMGIQRSAEGYGLGVGVADLNNDGWDDIYVANDFFEHDYLYLNQGAGRGFRESIHFATRQTSFFSMGVDLADFNNDGWQDVVVLDMAAEDQQRQKANMAGISRAKFSELVEQGYHHQYMYNSLQLNNGPTPGSSPKENNVSFSNIARMAGVAQTDWSWAPLLADFDNDGHKDLLITNGLRKDVLNNDFISGLGEDLQRLNTDFVNLSPEAARQQLDRMPSQPVPNYLFRNQGDLNFENQTKAWGLGEPTFSNGAAYADLDNDGDLDLVINNLDNFASVYENRSASSDERFLRVKLQGSAQNPFGVGSKVTIYHEGSLQFQQLYPTRGFQSAVEPILHFGVGAGETIDSLRVEWYDRKTTVLTNVASNQVVTVAYSQAEDSSERPAAPRRSTLFQEVTGKVGLNFSHREKAYNDFDYEFLIPRQFSRQGPALVTGDVNGDGQDDVFVGGARGQAGQLFLQTARGTFTKAAAQPWNRDAESEDVRACLFDADQDQDLDLYVGHGSSEYDSGSVLLQDRLYLNDGRGGFRRADEALPDLRTNTASVEAGDFDQDGDLDLFVGGGVASKRYPYPAPSYLLENQGGTFVEATASKAPDLQQPGIVNDAQWTDYNRDGWPDLLVVGEWMPIRFYTNRQGVLQLDTTVTLEQDGAALAHSQTAGWWQSVAPMDVDGDGNQDYVLGNAGRNQRFRPTRAEPVELFAGDFDQNGTGDLLLGYYQAGKLYPVAGREDLSAQMPLVKKLYPNYTTYARATVPEMLTQFPGKAQLHRRAHTFEHIYLRNDGSGKFILEALPPLAQVASVRAIAVHDVDGDGQQDALLVGNTYEIETKTPRDDAGVGLLLLGNGSRALVAVPLRESGFYAPHNARGVAWVKGKQGARVVVANDNDALQVFQLTQ